MNQPLVSILIPCRNAGPWLEATLESATGQTWANKEIIVADDGSTDDSRHIAGRFASRGVRLVAGPSRNAAAARNCALREARGDYLQFLDADDLLAPDKIEQQMQRVKDGPAGTVLTGRWGRFIATPSETHFYDQNPLFNNLDPADFLKLYASNDCMMHPAAWLVPASIAKAAGPWDERLTLNDDGEFFCRVVAASGTVAYCPEALSYYRSSLPNSLSGQRGRRHLESAYLALTAITARMLELENSSGMHKAAADLCQRFAYDYYPDCPDLVDKALEQARHHGGSDLQPLGGRTFQLACRFAGWKLARQFQRIPQIFSSPSDR